MTSRIRNIVASLLLMCVIGGGVLAPAPADAVASWPDAIGPTIANNIDRAIKTVGEIRKAMMSIVLMQGMALQVNRIIDAAGGRITDWRGYLQLPKDAALAQAQQQMTQLTRSATYLTDLGNGNAGQVSASGDLASRNAAAIAAAIEDVRKGNLQQVTPVTAVIKGPTLNPATGMANIFGSAPNPGIAAFTQLLTPQNNAMGLYFIAQGQVGINEELNRAALIAQQDLPGFNGPNPQLLQDLQKNVSLSVMSSVPGLVGDTAANVVGPMVQAMLAKVLANLTGTVQKSVADQLRSVTAQISGDRSAGVGSAVNDFLNTADAGVGTRKTY